MKRFTILIISILTFSIRGTFAQATWSIGAGYDQMFIQGYGCDDYMMEGFHIGPELRYDFFRGKGFGLQTAIYYRYAAHFYRNAEEQIHWEENHRNGTLSKYGFTPIRDFYHYVNIPIHVTYTHKFYNHWTLSAYSGPAIDWAFFEGERSKVFYSADGMESSGDEFGIGFCGPFNLTWDFGIGFSYKHLQMKVAYGLGCLKEEKAWNEQWETVEWVRPHRLSLTVSYQF